MERSQVRAAAITTLAQIAKNDPNILESVLILIKSCINDADDEVRERAFLYSKALSDQNSKDIIFNSNTVETELVSSIITSQKEALLKSSNIFDFLRNMIRNPNVLELSRGTSSSDKLLEDKNKNKKPDSSTVNVIQSDDPLAEYKKTNFGKAFPNPKNVSQFTVN